MSTKSLKSLPGGRYGSYGEGGAKPLISFTEVYGSLTSSKEGRCASAPRPSMEPSEREVDHGLWLRYRPGGDQAQIRDRRRHGGGASPASWAGPRGGTRRATGP